MTTSIEITPQTNIRELVAALPVAEAVLTEFGLHCAGCGVNKYETIGQGAVAHGLRVEPIVAALTQARLSGRVPTIMNEDRTPRRRAPGEFNRRAKFKYVVPIMSGKGGVGKSLTTALLAVGLRPRRAHVGERHAGHDPHRGDLVGEHGQIEDPHAGGAHEHDRGHGDDEDEAGDEAALVQEVAEARAARGRGRLAAARGEAAHQELQLVADGHGQEGAPGAGLRCRS